MSPRGPRVDGVDLVRGRRYAGPMSANLEKRRITVDEYQQMGDVGIFSEDDRVELIDGEILAMTPIGPLHASVVDRATRLFTLAAGTHAIVRVQSPIRLNLFTEPEPAISLLRPQDDFYRAGHPQPPDVLLVIEVADASLRYDRELKAPLYAQAGIVEYWIVDLANVTVTRHAMPEDGVYREVTIHGKGQSMSPRQLPHCIVTIDDLL